MKYIVYWLDNTENEGGEPRVYVCNDLDTLMQKAEELRTFRRNGAKFSHIVTSIEDPNNMTMSGVDVTDENYDWRKRR
jgi:hypothetical protein